MCSAADKRNEQRPGRGWTSQGWSCPSGAEAGAPGTRPRKVSTLHLCIVLVQTSGPARQLLWQHDLCAKQEACQGARRGSCGRASRQALPAAQGSGKAALELGFLCLKHDQGSTSENGQNPGLCSGDLCHRHRHQSPGPESEAHTPESLTVCKGLQQVKPHGPSPNLAPSSCTCRLSLLQDSLFVGGLPQAAGALCFHTGREGKGLGSSKPPGSACSQQFNVPLLGTRRGTLARELPVSPASAWCPSFWPPFLVSPPHSSSIFHSLINDFHKHLHLRNPNWNTDPQSSRSLRASSVCGLPREPRHYQTPHTWREMSTSYLTIRDFAA